jgi:hypothetical protein
MAALHSLLAALIADQKNDVRWWIGIARSQLAAASRLLDLPHARIPSDR